MNKKSQKLVRRRSGQSYTLNELKQIAEEAVVEKLPFKDDDLYGDAVVNAMLKVFRKVGRNKLPPGEGKYIHPIELAKVIGAFNNDASGKDKDRRDSGTILVQRAIAPMNQKLKNYRRGTANLPAAGYRIASDEESLLEVSKSLRRSMGAARAAAEKSYTTITPDFLSKEQKETFKEILDFTNMILDIFEKRFPRDPDDDHDSLTYDVHDRPDL